MFGFNYFQLGAMALGALIPILLLIHFWPKLRPALGRLFGSRVSKELDREHVDLETFLTQLDALRAQATVLARAGQPATPAAPAIVVQVTAPDAIAGAHADVDKQIEALLARKAAIDRAQAAVNAANAELARVTAA